MAQSKALPFLAAPKKLDGSMAGDFGFDPMGISDQVANLKYVRAAELKHCRVAMLAFLGWVVQQFVHLPGEIYAESNPLKALSTVPLLSHMQIFLFIAAIELATVDRTYTADKPWDLGFDPANLSKVTQNWWWVGGCAWFRPRLEKRVIVDFMHSSIHPPTNPPTQTPTI
jgi:hypothetical protein